MDSFKEGGLELVLSKSSHKIPEYYWGKGKKLECTKPLRPIGATSYCRRHFYDGSTRITIDYNTNYYGVGIAYNIPYACRYPTENFVKVEVKYISTDKPKIVSRIQALAYRKQADSSPERLRKLFNQFGSVKYQHPDEENNIEREIKLAFEGKNEDTRKMLVEFVKSVKNPLYVSYYSNKTSRLRYICFPNGSNIALVYFPSGVGLKYKQNIDIKHHMLIRKETFVNNANVKDLRNLMEELGNICITEPLANTILSDVADSKQSDSFVITKPLTRERDIYTVYLTDTGGTFTIVADRVDTIPSNARQTLYQIGIEPDGYIHWDNKLDYEKTVNHDLHRIKKHLVDFAEKAGFPTLVNTHLCKSRWATTH